MAPEELALMIGAGRGIGCPIAPAFAKDGVDVAHWTGEKLNLHGGG